MNLGDCDLQFLEEMHRPSLKFDSEYLNSVASFLETIDGLPPDLIFVDCTQSFIMAEEALGMLHACGKNIPFIIITTAENEEEALSFIQKGADDYLVKEYPVRHALTVKNVLEKYRLIKEKSAAVRKQQQKEQRYNWLLENSGAAELILSAEGKPLQISSSITKMLGYTEGEIMLMDLFTIAHPDDRQALTAVLEKAIANPGVSVKGHTGRIRHKNGSWRWLEATVTSMLHDPEINGIVDNFRDITDRKLAEEALISNENKFRGLIEHGSDGIAILSETGKPIYISPSIKNILGYTQEEGMALDLFSLAHADDVAILISIMTKVMETPGMPVRGNAVRMRHKDGEWRWIDGVLTNMLHDASVGGIVDNFRDVTQRKLAEAKIKYVQRLYAFISQINQ